MIPILLALAVAAAAFAARALSASGALAAAALGYAALRAGTDWAWLLVGYFVAASALSRLGTARKRAATTGMLDKDGPRDGRQVLSNGLPFLVAALAAPQSDRPLLWMAVAAGSLAASAADTWATEIGTLVGQRPRSIISWRPLAVGQSGGVTAAGFAAALAGAIFVAGLARVVGWPGALVLAVAAAGFTGSVVDSLLGALAQRRSWCDSCDEATEMHIHRCGTPSRMVGGLAFLDNDAVNLTANAIGALMAAGLGA